MSLAEFEQIIFALDAHALLLLSRIFLMYINITQSHDFSRAIWNK